MAKYEQPEIKIFHGNKKGLSLLIFGAIHGDEVCGPFSIKKIIKDIESKRIIIEKGTIVLVPICNPIAYKKRMRFVEENLNRVFKTWSNSNSYEKKLANSLTLLVKNCDIFLDIHSMEAKSVPMTFIDSPNKSNVSFSRILGANYSIEGWPELYRKNGQGISSYDTMAYAEKHSKKCAVIECGQHKDINSKKVAYQTIINTLRHFGFIDGKVKSKKLSEIRMKKLFIKENKKDFLIKNWKNFDSFKKGDILASKSDGKKIIAAFNGVIIFPNEKAKVGTEWFYLGTIKQ
ncbi:MAG: hypothetical protein A2998_02035 [Candidatus Staskawiczbacteria bacterium RIFCSPLOWO2_01_FULL_37_25b]|uniref:Succinylglutamate desuccinylase/Aspartoacylase catalytic domain-containing protein n=1 Tax=Candidatus Staskawiczbacteria bacterium RIFCSPLOWO2_01_FULL_37_25b TaxID=1802213 RepID=A0A1G2IG91_9BACT|nr:MAG: hypothetical protein A2998_02035 [Candidatus Staskawiczbacteria bacterium RIFCSPLOWO2_01_FULL_37_25b]